MRFLNDMKSYPIIAAVRNFNQFEAALSSKPNTIFILSSDIFNLTAMVSKAKTLHKNVFVHMDFIGGLASDHVAIDYLLKTVNPTGIISTKSPNVKYAISLGILTIQRFFVLDSQSYLTMIKTIRSVKPPVIEILPGIMPDVISKIKKEINVPVISGGLIDSKKQADMVLSAGASAVSTSCEGLWY